jgi:hypothetical protein
MAGAVGIFCLSLCPEQLWDPSFFLVCIGFTFLSEEMNPNASVRNQTAVLTINLL